VANVAKRRGLPSVTTAMKHEPHYVEELAKGRQVTVGALIRLDQVRPNPRQPRRNFDDIEELRQSVAEKGVLEPILVRPEGSGYVVIAGERRYRAALLAGLTEVPAMILKGTSENDALEIALVENIQRKDLTAFEEAAAFKELQDRFGLTHERIAQRLGKARTTVTETLQLAEMPAEIKTACEKAGILSRSVLLEILKQPSPEAMFATIDRVAHGQVKRAEMRQERRPKGAGRPKNYVFRFAPADKRAVLELRFNKSKVERAEVVDLLRAILRELSPK